MKNIHKNITLGQRFGTLTAIEETTLQYRTYAVKAWVCLCDCGEEEIKLQSVLLKHHNSTCAVCRGRRKNSLQTVAHDPNAPNVFAPQDSPDLQNARKAWKERGGQDARRVFLELRCQSLRERLGWDWIGRHTIWKEPLWVRNRTMTKNLAHKTICTDATLAGVASADYLLVFRKRGTNPIPVAHERGLDYYAGECPMPADILRYRGWKGNQIENRFSHWIWRRYASSVWDDIRMGRVLPYRDCREPDDEKHVHPLQLDVIERDVQMRTLPGEIVLTPFMGVGSEAYGAVRAGRRAVGIELKTAYYRQAVANMAMVHKADDDAQINLFDEAELDMADTVLEAVAV